MLIRGEGVLSLSFFFPVHGGLGTVKTMFTLLGVSRWLHHLVHHCLVVRTNTRDDRSVEMCGGGYKATTTITMPGT